MENHKIVPVCLICHQVPRGGIRAGIFIKGKFICDTCEKQLIEADKENDLPKDFLKNLRPLGLVICREA